MSFNEFEKVFLTRCEEYAKKLNALGTKTTSEKKTTFFSINLPSIKLQFIYRKKEAVLTYQALFLPVFILIKKQTIFIIFLNFLHF